MNKILNDNKMSTMPDFLGTDDGFTQTAVVDDDIDNTPVPEGEYMSLAEFKAHFEKRIYERLGLKINLQA